MASTDSEQGVQSFIHSMQQGRFAPLVKGLALAIVLLTITLLYLFVQFSGFNSETAMDQAQISRALASGEGFSTKYIRPMALWRLNESELEIPTGNFPDFLHPPLYPAWNVLPLTLAKENWDMTTTDLVYAGDRVIAGFSILLFFAAVAVFFLVAQRLFDTTLAFVAVILVLITDVLWQFSLSGLPQMLAMLLLAVASYLILRAMGDAESHKGVARVWWLHALIGLAFGLMTLTHWITLWLFVGYLVFAFIYFRPRFFPVISILVFVLALAPWLARNAAVSGDIFGLAIYPLVGDTMMRSLDPDFSDLFYGFRQKFRMGVVSQLGELLAYLGLNLAAGAFFLALFHPFKRPETANFRWCVVAMWVFAVIGMASYGPVSGTISINQLHSIFIPLFVAFGLAFLLVLWNRLGFQMIIMRTVFHVMIIILCAIPMLLTLFAGQSRMINWPPYIPPYIAVLGDFYGEDEAICSDMPWAVAWYAQRKCLLLPDTPKTMIEISDYDVIGAPIRGLYLTPVTGNADFFSGIVSGKYSAWAGLILRNPPPQGFPLRAVLPLPIEGQTILFADRDRWSKMQKSPRRNSAAPAQTEAPAAEAEAEPTEADAPNE